jgi:hypothetical protein
MRIERLHGARRLLAGSFAATLALLLGLWSWASMASSASLSLSPTTARQNDTVTLVGQGFSPGETVAVWITYPDFRVFGVAEVEANGDGSFNYPYLPDFLGATFTPTGKYTYTAHGKDSGREVYADLHVNIGAAPGTSTSVKLSADPRKDSQGSSFVFRGSGYLGGEDVAVWLRYPDNTVVDLGRISAGPTGSIEYVLSVAGAPVGRYAFTARGLSSGANGIAEFNVSVDDLTIAAGKAALSIGPSPDNQRSFATFSASGFLPKEIVTIWVTLPDFSTRWVGDVQANADGAFTAVLYLSEQEPVGKRTYTAFGNDSSLRAIASYTLTPGGGPGTTSAQDLQAPPADACIGGGCF